jgi:hypothetical protein
MHVVTVCIYACRGYIFKASSALIKVYDVALSSFRIKLQNYEEIQVIHCPVLSFSSQFM